ncbi:hypothetical protein C8F04DRAFT_1192689 [Mycena alexandri]|uniref:Uncharacterized protein n=1 Tax=Mycena alexandri TaxID=1745969 RepID=A0AAD6SAA6_9AGAR|nr:hypothetical protein C8F04DRAFT_1192689 [Mycena alexandri]
MNTRSSSASTVDSSRSSSGTASPAHGGHPVLSHIPSGLHSPASPPPPPHSTPVPHPHPHAHPHSPLGESSFVPDADADVAPAQDAPAPAAADSPAASTAAARAKFINSLKSKNGAWDALIHGSFS